MFKWISLAFFCFMANVNFAHKYYFGFAEVEYNQMQERLEGTLIFSLHDLEDVLLKKGVIEYKFEQLKHDSITMQRISREVFSSFSVYHALQKIQLKLIDFFLTKTGTVELYFNSERVRLANRIEIQFSTLMEEFPEQQNKITFIQQTAKQTAVFLNKETKNELTIYN